MKELYGCDSNIDLFFTMEDISNLPEWNQEEALKKVKENPLDQKMMKSTLDRIYMISGYNEQEYLGDVIQAYSWIKLAVNLPDLSPMLGSEKLEKYFLEDFVYTSIRYMILCRKFKLKEMMVLTQQMMVEALRLFTKFFNQLEKYPNSFVRRTIAFFTFLWSLFTFPISARVCPETKCPLMLSVSSSIATCASFKAY